MLYLFCERLVLKLFNADFVRLLNTYLVSLFLKKIVLMRTDTRTMYALEQYTWNIYQRKRKRDRPLFSKYLFCGRRIIYYCSLAPIFLHRKPAAELIRSWEMTDGHLEKRHSSSSLSDLFPRGKNYKCIFIARHAIVVSQIEAALNHEDSEKKGWKVAAMAGSRTCDCGKSFVCFVGAIIMQCEIVS